MTRADRRPRHAAAVYDSPEDLQRRVLPWVRAGLERGEGVAAVVGDEAREVLRDGLGPDADQVSWALPGVDFRHVGRAFEALRQQLRGPGAPARVLTENLTCGGPGRPAAHLRADAVSNDTHPPTVSWACLYDRRHHRARLLELARQAHPLLLDAAGRAVPSDCHVDADTLVTAEPGPLSDVPREVPLDLAAGGFADLPAVRHRVASVAGPLGLAPADCHAVALATGEVVTNAVQHGAAPLRVRLWPHRRTLVVRVDDGGRGAALRAAGLRPPEMSGCPARGMWVVRQLADVVHVGVEPGCTSVELQFPLR